MGCRAVHTVRINRGGGLTSVEQIVEMTESIFRTTVCGNFLYRKRQSVVAVLYRLYNHCYVVVDLNNFVSWSLGLGPPLKHTVLVAIALIGIARLGGQFSHGFNRAVYLYVASRSCG
jgi:hypothetical protein